MRQVRYMNSTDIVKVYVEEGYVHARVKTDDKRFMFSNATVDVTLCKAPSVCDNCPVCNEANKKLTAVTMLKDYFKLREELEEQGFKFLGITKELANPSKAVCLKTCDINSTDLNLQFKVEDRFETCGGDEFKFRAGIKILYRFVTKSSEEALTEWKELVF